MSGPTTHQRIARRKALLSWIPTAVLTVVIAGVIFGVFAVQNSWWVRTDTAPSADQQATDGTSMFGQGGVDYLTRSGTLRVSLRDTALPASDLALDAEGERRIETLVPVDAVLLAPEGAFGMRLIDAFTITTREDRVVALTLEPDASGGWQRILATLTEMAPAWGWTSAQIAALDDALTAASRATDGAAYTATLGPASAEGVSTSAEIFVDPAGGVRWSVTLEVSP